MKLVCVAEVSPPGKGKEMAARQAMVKLGHVMWKPKPAMQVPVDILLKLSSFLDEGVGHRGLLETENRTGNR